MPSPPDDFTPDEIGFWNTYCEILQQENELKQSILPTLSDLCRWEGLKVRAIAQLPEDHLYMEYYNEAGEISHTQPHAALSNLKAIQQAVNVLREKLGLTDKNAGKKRGRPPEIPKLNRKDW